MKRVSLLLAAFLLVALLLSGCGKQSAFKDDPSKEVHLVWYTIGQVPEDLPLVTEAINKYTKEKLNTTVEFRYLDWGEYDSKIKTLCSAGEKFDLMLTCSWTNQYSQAAASGFLAPLDELMKEYGQEAEKAIDPVMLEGSRINGVLYALPSNKELGTIWNFVVNKNILEKYNVDITKIKQLSDWGSAFAKIHAADSQVYGLGVDCNHGFLLKDYDFIIDCKYPGAVRMDDNNCKVVNQFEDAAFIDNLRTYREFYQKGYIRKDAFTISFNQLNADFNAGRTVAVFQEDIRPAVEKQPFYSAGLSEAKKMPVYEVPSFEPPMITTHSVTGGMVGISAASENPARAMRFLNLLNTDVYLRNLVGYGIEGTHYRKTGATTIETLPRSGKYAVMNSALGNCMILYTTQNDPADLWERIRKINAVSKKSPLLGFSFNADPVKNEIAQMMNLQREYLPALFVGAVDVDSTLKKYNEKARAAGMDKIIAEMQKQIDTWKAAKK